jgi:hypothetical protein
MKDIYSINIRNRKVLMEDAKKMLEETRVINIGLLVFAESLADQGVKLTHVDWQPPAGGNKELQRILNALMKD